MTAPDNPRMRPWITEDDKKAVLSVLDSGDLMGGKQVQAFEEELAAYFGRRHAVCVASGTAALECAFVATGEGYAIHPHGFVAALSAVKAAHLVDIVAVHERGTRTDVLGVHAAPIGPVHDCAHRFDKGAAHADVSCFSFAPNKFIAACGGCLVTNDSVVAAKARQYRNHGRDGGPEIFSSGRNLRMGEVNAALGRSQLKRIDQILARRKQVAHWYDDVTGQKIADTRASWFLYPWNRLEGGFGNGAKPAPVGQRTMRDFRLSGPTFEDDCTWLMPIWPMMTREDVEAVCK